MEDKATVISIDVVDEDHSEFRFKFKQSKPHSTWLDWGDGSQREAFDETDTIAISHTYSDPGQYDILLFAVDEGTIELDGIDADIGYRSMVTNLVIGKDVSIIHSFAFSDCENLEEVEFLGENTELGNYSFSGCTSLTSAKLPSQMSIIPDGIFFNCFSLKTCEIPDNVGTINLNAFYGCSQLKSVNLSNVYEVGDYAFDGCRKLSAIVFGETSYKIGNGSFGNCTSLRTIELGSIKEIGDTSFSSCRSLVRIAIPETVNRIGDQAFENCLFLKEIKMEGRRPPVIASSNVFPSDLNYKILVPGGTRREYKDNENCNRPAVRQSTKAH